MLQLTYLEYWRTLPPAGKLLVLYVGAMILVATLKVIACLASRSQWAQLGAWLRHAAVSMMMCSFLYASYIGQLIAIGNRHFSDERASGYIILMKELTFHFRVLSVIALIFFVFFVTGWSISSRSILGAAVRCLNPRW
jgi:hypothetical protein